MDYSTERILDKAKDTIFNTIEDMDKEITELTVKLENSEALKDALQNELDEAYILIDKLKGTQNE